MRRILVCLLCLIIGSVATTWAEGRRHVLAVVPILVDQGSVIEHPQKDQVLELLRFNSQGREEYLAERLRKGGRFFDVRLAQGDPGTLFDSLVIGSQLQGGETEERRLYRFAPAGVQQVSETVVAERVLVLILHGEKALQERWDRNRVSYLTTRYNTVFASAFLLDTSGQVLWQYKTDPIRDFLPLQYPNFDDAHYNKSNQVPLVFLKVEGLERYLLEKETSFFNRPSNTPKIYKDWMDDLTAKLQAAMPK